MLCAATAAAATGPSSAAPTRVQDTSTTSADVARVAGAVQARLRGLTLPEKIAQLQEAAPAVPRLGLRAYDWWSEGLHGLARNGPATVFPQAIGLAASWDAPLLHAVGRQVAADARTSFAAGHGQRYAGLDLWSPNINIFRDPRWGRGQETYGEDPTLTARLAVAFVRGLQGDDPAEPTVIATPKHFAVHSGPEAGRHAFDVAPTAHDLEDTYLPAFRAAVTEGHAGSVMCAYNALDGTPACANADLLQRRLRGDWGFRGYVVSDCDAVEDMTLFHHSTADAAEASARSLLAGTDLNCGTSYAALAEAVERRLVTEADIDRALTRVLTARARLAVDAPRAATAPSSAADTRALALRAARESMVLLKNERGVLPLRAGSRIAVVGPTADLLEDLEANYHGTAVDPVTPLAGLQRVLGADHVVHAQGSTLATGVGVAIPATALRDLDGAPGLTAAYRVATPAGAAMDGATVRRNEPHLDADDDRAPPAPRIPAGPYVARWDGTLLPPAPGDYRLGVRIDRCFDCRGHDGVKLWLDGRLLQDGSGGAADVAVHFADTAPHALRVERDHAGDDGGITLQWQAPAEAQIAEAVAAAATADAVVAFVGLSPALEGEQLQIDVPGFAGGDRTTLDLPDVQERLLRALGATGKPLIVVLQCGSAVALNWAAAHADAVLAAWYPGEAGGLAIAETLSGAANPAGRLPVTFYRSVADLPAFDDYRMQGRTYRYFSGEPLYPFGHGLSYTRFAYGAPTVSTHRLRAGQPLQIAVDVRNTGSRDGDEVVQVYWRPPPTPPTPPTPEAPRHALVAFARVALRAGEGRRVRLTVTPRAMSVVGADGTRAVEPGVQRLYAGGGQPVDTPGASPVGHADITVLGRRALPR